MGWPVSGDHQKESRNREAWLQGVPWKTTIAHCRVCSGLAKPPRLGMPLPLQIPFSLTMPGRIIQQVITPTMGS